MFNARLTSAMFATRTYSLRDVCGHVYAYIVCLMCDELSTYVCVCVVFSYHGFFVVVVVGSISSANYVNVSNRFCIRVVRRNCSRLDGFLVFLIDGRKHSRCMCYGL